MTQLITCPSCKQQLQVPVEFLGQPVKCPGCGVAFVVTAAASGAPAPPSPGGPALRVFFVFHSLLIIAAALAMMNRRLYALAVTGSLASMIYINYCCCLLGFPIGLWALLVFFFNDTATTEIYPLSLHDALL